MQNYLKTYLWHLNIWIRQPCDNTDHKWLRDERERVRKALTIKREPSACPAAGAGLKAMDHHQISSRREDVTE